MAEHMDLAEAVLVLRGGQGDDLVIYEARRVLYAHAESTLAARTEEPFGVLQLREETDNTSLSVCRYIDSLTAQIAEARRERDVERESAAFWKASHRTDVLHEQLKLGEIRESLFAVEAERDTARAALVAMRERVLALVEHDDVDPNAACWITVRDVRAAVEE